MQESLLTIGTRHQSHFERLKSHEVSKFDPFIKRLDKDIREVLTKQGDNVTRKALEAQIKQIEAGMTGTLEDYRKVWADSTKEIAINEAAFERKTLENVVDGVNFKLPSDTQIMAAVNAAPISASGGKVLSEVYKDFSKAETRRIGNVIRLGYAEGQTTPQIIKRVRGTSAAQFRDGTLAQVKRKQEMMVRTTLTHTANQARAEVMRANSKAIDGYVWTATLDSRTGTADAALDGKFFKDGNGPLPPLHMNCVLGDARVTSATGISVASKRIYKGEVVTIETVSGNVVTLTPNHPVLTTTGWVDAKLLNVGDKCITQARCKGIRVGNSNNHRSFIMFKDLFETLRRDSRMIAVKVPVSSPDFHGDAGDNEVAEILIARNLLPIFNTGLIEHLGKFRFDSGDTRGGDLPLQSFSTFYQGFQRWSAAAHSVVRGLSKFINFIRRSMVHARLLLLASISWLNAIFYKNTINSGTCKTNFLGNASDSDTFIIKGQNIVNADAVIASRRGIDRNPSTNNNSSDYSETDTDVPAYFFQGDSATVVADDIVNVSIRKLDLPCHIYNLQTLDHTYAVNGIITHNCRCSTVAHLKESLQFLSKGRTRAARDVKMKDGKLMKGKSIKVKNQTYYSWMKTQPASVQDSIIGKSRGQLLRNGGLTSDRFAELQIGKNFEPLTLEQMKKLDPVAFTKAGL